VSHVLDDTPAAAPSVIMVVGLLFEAHFAERPTAAVVCRGNSHRIATTILAAARSGCHRIVSFGMAGGLAPDLRPGDWIVASRIIGDEVSYATDPALSRLLLENAPGAEYAPIIGVDAPVADPASKRALHARGLAAVDMESHIVARLAVEHRLALGAIRVIIDPAHRRIPAAALVGFNSLGAIDPTAVIRALIGRPRDLPLVAMLAFDAVAARRALQRIHQMLANGFGRPVDGKR